MLGMTNEEMAKFFEVGLATFNRWMSEKDGFRDAIKEGRDLADADVAHKLYRRATGYSHPDVHISNYQGVITVTEIVKHYPPETMACIYWLNNRQRGRWSRAPDPNGGETDLPPTKVIFEVRDARSPKRQSEPE